MRQLPYVITCSKCQRPNFFYEDYDSAKCYWCGTPLSELLHKEISLTNFLDLAKVESNARNWKDADRYYAKALEVDPNNVEAWLGRAIIAEHLAETTHDIDFCRQAVVYIERALEAGAHGYDCGYLFVHLAIPFAEAGDFETAKSLVERGVRLEPPIDLHVESNIWPRLGDIAASQREYDLARSLYERSDLDRVSIIDRLICHMIDNADFALVRQWVEPYIQACESDRGKSHAASMLLHLAWHADQRSIKAMNPPECDADIEANADALAKQLRDRAKELDPTAEDL